MRLLPALLLSVAVHAAVLAMAAPQPVDEDAPLEVAVRLETSGQGRENGRRAALSSPKAEAKVERPRPEEASAPTPTPPPRPVATAQASAPEPRQTLSASAAPAAPVAPVASAEPKQARRAEAASAEPEAREQARIATATSKTLKPVPDHTQTATTARAVTQPLPDRAASVNSASTQTPSAQSAPAQTSPAQSAQELVAALAQSLADKSAPSAASSADPGAAPGKTAGPVRFGSDEGPKFLKRAAIEYPSGALRADRQGRVVVLLELDDRGKLLRADIAESAGPRLDRAALRFARASTYAPAARAGRPVPCKALLPITFNLAR